MYSNVVPVMRGCWDGAGSRLPGKGVRQVGQRRSLSDVNDGRICADLGTDTRRF